MKKVVNRVNAIMPYKIEVKQTELVFATRDEEDEFIISLVKDGPSTAGKFEWMGLHGSHFPRTFETVGKAIEFVQKKGYEVYYMKSQDVE